MARATFGKVVYFGIYFHIKKCVMAGRHDTRQKMEQEWKADSSHDKQKAENAKWKQVRHLTLRACPK